MSSLRGIVALIILALCSLSPTQAETAELVVEKSISQTLFDKFLKYKNYRVTIQTDDVPRLWEGGFVHGPGHHSASMACFVFDQNQNPYFVLKSGDTRFPRTERGEPYVLDGVVAGRLDKKGAEGAKIAMAELAEEVGGEIVEGSFRPLGRLSPTMPFESTECDMYFLGAARILKKPTGDGGKMELLGLIGPKFLKPTEAIRQMDKGLVSDGNRARTMYGRGLHAMGYLPQLGVFVQDHPKLLAKYKTLGLGKPVDLRQLKPQSDLPEEQSRPETFESKVNHSLALSRKFVKCSSSSRIVDARTKHAVRNGKIVVPLGEEFPNQYLQLDYDRLKLVTYYFSPSSGPMVQMTKQARPILSFAPRSPSVLRLDVEDVKVPRGEFELKNAERLGAASGASSGQADLYYTHWAKRVKAIPSGFIPLAEALELCRTGHGDSQTEALLLKLADKLEWSVNLGMSWKQAEKLL